MSTRKGTKVAPRPSAGEPKREQITINVRLDLLETIEEEAARLGMSRSMYIAVILEALLERKKNNRIHFR